jgi:hypothetical protein
MGRTKVEVLSGLQGERYAGANSFLVKAELGKAKPSTRTRRPAMLQRILVFSTHRVAVVLRRHSGAVGAHSLTRLPIDAVPDITNRQVVINSLNPSLSPTEMEKQVTFLIETVLAGIPGLDYTRSFSRNGFSQVTAVFGDDVDIYFARQQVAERLTAARGSLPPGSESVMGPISTGLGEVYLWTVEFQHPRGREPRQRTVARGGRVTARTSPRKARCSGRTWSGRPTFAPSRTGSSGRN